MLKFESSRGKVEFDCKGKAVEVMSDFMCVVNVLYGSFKESGNGEFFREFLTQCVNDGSAFTDDGYPEEEL